MSKATTKPQQVQGSPSGQQSAVIAKMPVLRDAGFSSDVPTVPQDVAMTRNAGMSDLEVMKAANAAAVNGRTSARIHTPYSREELCEEGKDGIDPNPESSGVSMYNKRRGDVPTTATYTKARGV